MTGWRRREFLGVAVALAAPLSARGAALDLTALETRHGGRIGIAAHDLTSGRKVGWRAGERFAYCSTFKLFLAAAVLQRVAAGKERLDRQVPVTAADIVSHAPVTGPMVGKTMSVEALCEAMVDVSDNPAANIMIRQIGGLDAWRGWYRSIGDKLTTVDRFEPALNSAKPGDPRDTTTPAQAATNVAKVLAGDLLTPAHRALLTRWAVATPTGPGRIKAGVPAGSIVAHKTGTADPGPTNDIGLVWLPDGRVIAVAAYFTESNAPTQADRDAVIAEATRAAIAAMRRASGGQG